MRWLGVRVAMDLLDDVTDDYGAPDDDDRAPFPPRPGKPLTDRVVGPASAAGSAATGGPM